MSKITQALEKAARDRLARRQERATASSQPAVVPLAISPAPESDERLAKTAEIDPHIISATDPGSPIAEQYRILRTNLQALWSRPGPKTIVVTSAVHNEGKSVTAINQALTFARQQSLRVLLVDGDLRKGSVNTWLGLRNGHLGLSSQLPNGADANQALLRLQEPPLSVLPAGPNGDHPAELLASAEMKRLLAGLRAQFDLLLIDAPPVLPVADPAILAAQADGVLLVVRAGSTQRKTVERAHTLLTQAKAKLLGCVLTHFEHYLPNYYQYYHAYRREATVADHARHAEPSQRALPLP